MKRTLLVLAAVLAAVLVAAGALLYGLSSTETGLRWLAARAAAMLPEGSTFGDLRGRVRGPIESTGVRVVAAGFLIEIERLTLEWSPLALVNGRAHLRRVDASGVRVQRLDAASAARTPQTLPVSVLIDALSIKRLELVPTPEGAPILVDEVTLAARLDGDGIAVSSLRASGRGATAEGELAFGAATPLTSRLVWSFTPPDLPPLQGELRAHARGDDIAVTHTLAAPYNLAFDGVLDPRAWRLRGRLDADALALAALRAGWPEVVISGGADLDGTLDTLGAALEAQVTLGGGAPIALTADVSTDRERLVVTRMQVRAEGFNAEGRGEASLRELLGGDPALVPVVLEVDAFDLLVPRVGAVRGAGRAAGTFAEHEITAQGNLATPGPGAETSAPREDGTWTLAARGASRVLTIDALDVALADGSVRTNGTLDWRTAPLLELQAQVRGANPGRLWPIAEGRLDADARISVQPAARRASLALESLSGTLRGRALRGRGGVRYDDGAWGFDALELEAGDARLAVSGALAELTALRWTIDAPDLAAIVPSWSGSVRGAGRVDGARGKPVVGGEIEAQGVTAGDFAAGAVQGRWSIDLSGRTPAALNLTADALVAGGRRIDSVRVEGSGPVGAHTVDVAVDAGEAHTTLTLAGAYDGRAWAGRIEAMQIEAPAVGRWTLAQPAALSASRGHVALERACWNDATSTSCLELDWRAREAWRVRATLDGVALAAFAPFLPPALDYGGIAAGEVELAGAGRAITTAEATIGVTPGAIVQRDPPERLLAWQRAHAEAHLVGNRVLVTADVELEGSGRLALDVALPSVDPGRFAQAPLDGRIEGVLTEIPLLAALLPDVSALRGETRLDLRLAGTVAQPAVYGEVSFTNGAAELPRLGLALEDVAIVLRGEGRTLTLDARARSGVGTLVLGGTLEATARGWQGQGTITGQDFTAIALPDLEAVISPNVQVELDGRAVGVTGEVSVPYARVEPPDFVGGVRPSADVVIVGAEAQEDDGFSWLLDASVRVALGRDVRFNGFGLDAQVSGSVLAEERTGAPTRGTGELSVVEGTYTAYGRALTLERGRLLFNGGPIANPALDARASRRIEQQTVGVDARGTLRKPELKLYSDPAASQSDALALLLIGRPVSGLSSGEQIELAATTRQIGLSGAGFLASQVGRRIGLDEVGVENSGDTEQAALFIGKYLSPKLYVGYGLGLFETFNTVRVRYAFTPTLSLQAESGTEHSADVLYTIER